MTPLHVKLLLISRTCTAVIRAPLGDTNTQITCEGGKLPERFRASARALLQSSDGRGVSFGSEYVAVRAEIQEPNVSTTVYYAPRYSRSRGHSIVKWSLGWGLELIAHGVQRSRL